MLVIVVTSLPVVVLTLGFVFGVRRG